MSSPAQVVRAYLVQAKLVVMPQVLGQTVPYVELPRDDSAVCYVSSMPNNDDQAICIYDIPGIVFGRNQRNGRTQSHKAIKFMIRSLDYDVGADLADAVMLWVDGIPSMTSVKMTTEDEDDTRVYVLWSVYRTSELMTLGEEVGNRRQRWTFNAGVVLV